MAHQTIGRANETGRNKTERKQKLKLNFFHYYYCYSFSAGVTFGTMAIVHGRHTERSGRKY